MAKKQPKTEAEIHRKFLRDEKKKASKAEKARKGQPKVRSAVIC